MHPCDFYVLDKYKLGNIKSDNLINMRKSSVAKNFIVENKKVLEICKNCIYKNICNGGCKRLNSTFLSKDQCGYKSLLDLVSKDINEILYLINNL